MPKFSFTVKNPEGVSKRGIIEASDMRVATSLLHERGFTVINLSDYSENSIPALLTRLQRVSQKEITLFTRQLATMIGAGLNLLEALHVLSTQMKSEYFRGVVEELVRDIQGGTTFYGALRKHPTVFDTVYINIVKAGEESGKLDVVLVKMAETMEKQTEFERRVRGAMVYPAIVVFAMIVVSFIMSIFIVPRLAVVFDDVGARLPLPTRILLATSNFMASYWYLFILLAIGLFIAYRIYTSTENGKLMVSTILTKIPIMGPIIIQSSLTTFTRIFAILVSSGVTILDALKICAGIASNYSVKKSLEEIAQAVEKGSPISVPIARQRIFPPIVGQMVAVGEETGKIDEVLEKLSHYFEAETDQAVKNLTTAIEPLIIIVLGIVAAFVVMAVILPIYDLTTNVAP